MTPALLALASLLPIAAFAAQAAAKPDLESMVRRALPNCPGETKLTQEALTQTLPAGMTGKVFTIQNETPGCAGRYAAILTASGNFFLGTPWFVGGGNGTPAERIRTFALERFRESFKATVGSQKNQDQLFPVELVYNTEGGKVPMRGWTDAAGTVFFPGFFYPVSADFAQFRLQQLANALSVSPSAGPADAPVTLIEFSDFQCPSCRAAMTYVKPLLERHAGKVHYIRVDFPLLSSHPWALGAAVIGRAIYQQKPAAFWQFKDAVYENQSNLNLFTLEDFARGFVADQELNLELFNTAIASQQIRQQILDSVAAAHAINIFGTPTFLVNGQIVVPGQDGTNLEAAISKALQR